MIVRELTTNLKFKVDKKGIENFQRSIGGIKKQFLIASSAVTGFIAGFIKTASAVSNTILDMDQLSRITGTSIDKLISLQRLSSQFRIDKSQFNTAFNVLNDQLREAEQGFGNLRELAKDAKIEIFDQSGKALPTEIVFKNFLKALSQIENERDRFLLSQKIFGNPLFADVAVRGLDQLNKFDEESKRLAQTFKENVENARLFTQEMSRLGDVFFDLIHNVFPPLLKVTSNFLQKFNELISEITTFSIPQSHIDEVKRRFDEDNNSLNLPQNFWELLPSLTDPIRRYFNFDTKIEMTVPQGTNEQQQTFLTDAMQIAVSDVLVGEFQKIGNNFPQTA